MDDLISRQAAMDIADDIRDCISVDGYWAWMERLKALPTAEKKGEWIPLPIAELMLNSPITPEQWDLLKDVDFDHTDRIWFHTKHDKDVAFVKERKGKWINHRNDEGHNIADCDQCGEAMQWFDDDIKPNFCPNCGARMEESDEHTD